MRYLAPLIVSLLFSVPAVAQQQPNILLIIADDMGLDASACYDVGDQQAPMPNLERLCEEGLVFENAYAAPVCSPTRATIMTGLYGFRTGVGSAISRDGGGGLSPDALSLFDIMADTDYASALIGKWHLAPSGDELNHPAALGVTDYYGVISGGLRDYERFEVIEDGAPVRVSTYATTLFTDRAIDWIADQDSPWFLWLAYNAPHSPFHLPPTDLHGYGDLPDDEASIAANRLDYYNAALEALDTEIGRLLDSMPLQVRDNTIVMFLGDNGSPGQVARHLYGQRGAKGGIFEGGTHVPLIIDGPGVATGRTDALVNTTDLFTTIASIAGARAETSDAFDIAPVLSGGETARTYVYVEHFS
ncbi:MAG: sulfatase-like hydrolase/transferase, partial [Pseudomonadota bacterium]